MYVNCHVYLFISGIICEKCNLLQMDSLLVDVGVGIMNTGLNYDIHATFMNHGPRGKI
jgi:hypothetical protein